MTDYTPILSLPQVASNQEQKEATINTAIAILEAAMNDSLSVDLSAGDLTLNTDQFTKYFLLQFQGHTVPRVVQVPATPRWFAIENQGSSSVTVKCLGSTGLTAELPSGKIGLIVSDGADLRFVVPDAVNGMGLLADLSDVSGVPTNNQLLRWNATESNWMPWTLNLAFSQLTDFPGAYISYPGSILAVKPDGSGLEWTTSAANVNSFTDLDDTPGSYTGAANRAVRVNNAGTGLVFATPTLRENSDFPTNYTDAQGKFLRVNGTANGVVFGMPKLVDLVDGPGQPDIDDALLFLRVNAAGTGLEYVPGAGGPVNFTELLDTPGAFTGAANRVVRVNSTADSLIYSILKLSDLSDFPATYSGQGNKWLRVNGAQTGVTFADPKVIDLSDGPGAFTGAAKKFVRVNASANALEYYAPKLLDLSDFPAAYTGQGGKFLQVRPGEDGVRFVSSSFSAAFLDLTDTPDLYTGQVGKFVQVNPAGDGLIFASAAVNLNDLLDVDVDTTPAVPGSVLTFRDGAWTAEVLPASATNLNALTDVDLTTGTPAPGSVLTYRDGAWTAEPSAAAGVTYLAALMDVDFGSGEPAEGMSLVYRSGAWSAETLAAGGTVSYNDLSDKPFIPATLNDLSDVDVDTAPAVAGSVLTYRDGAWTAEVPVAPPSTLDSLTDVNAPAPASGEVLTYLDGEWVAQSPGALGVPAYGAYPYWRLLLHTTDGGTHFGVQELEFKNTKTGGDLANGGTPFASSEAPGQPVTGAFDNVVGGRWDASTGNDGEFIGYHFTAPVEVRYITIKGAQDTPNLSPASFSVQYSDDGVSYTTAWEVTGQTGWQAGQTREFHGLLDLFFTDLADVPQSFIGQGGKSLRVNSGGTALEFYVPTTPPSALNDLTDVDVDTTPAVAGSVLTYRDGAWTAEVIPTPALALNDLTDVDVDTSPAVNGEVLTYRDGAWTAQALPPGGGGGVSYLYELGDVYVLEPGPTAGQTLVYRNELEGTEGWYPADVSVPTLDAIGDVNYAGGPTFGQVLTWIDNGGSGEWQPMDAAGVSLGLDDLYDVELGDVAEGDVLSYRGGQWISASPSADFGSHAYWRVYVTQTVDGAESNVMITELAMRSAPGAGTLTTGGTAIADSGTPAGAFDNNASTMWQGFSGTLPQWVGYEFADPVSVVEIAITATNVYGWAQAYLPRDFQVQFSDDGSTWFDAWTVTGDAPYVANEVRVNTAPGVFSTFLDNTDTPDTYVGQGGKTVRVKSDASGLEFVTVAATGALNDLSDVDLTTGTPANGAVLTYRDGVWTSEEIPVAAGSEVPIGGEHAYWRLNLLSSQGSAYGVAKLMFAASASGADQATGGAPLSTNDYTAGGATYDRFKAFDNDASTFWASNDVAASTIGYQFTAPVAVGQIRLTTRPAGGFGAHGPISFEVQWSDNGTAWTTAWAATTPATWTVGETRSFLAPTETLPFVLNDLGDVDLSIDPVEDQVLTYVGGEWIAADLPARARNRGTYGDASVYQKRTFESGMPAGFEGAASALWSIVSQADAPYTKALRSRTIGSGGLTSFNFDVTATAACNQLRVRYKVTSEANFDKFRIFVDGVEKTAVSGSTGLFATEVITLTPGLREITFQYSKDGSGDVGTDDVLIPYVEFAYTDAEPYIVGDIVTHEGVTYQCLVDGATEEPGTGDDWSALGGGGSAVGVLDDLTDVEIVDATNGDVLTYDDGVWKAQPAGGSISLGDLTLTHGAALPTAPEPSGSLYLQDDAGDGFIADTVVQTGPLVIQSGTSTEIAANHVVTMPQAPTPGNWLIAFVATNGGTPVWQPGWVQFKSATGAYVGMFMARRMADAFDTTSITVATGNSGADPVTVFEVKGLGTDWAAVFDNAYAVGDSTAGGPPFNGSVANHTIVGPHGFGLGFICQRATQVTPSPIFTGDWTPAATYSNLSTNRQTGSGILIGRTSGQAAAMSATISPDSSHYGFGVVYFKTTEPYGNGTDIAWNRIMLEDRAEIADLADVSETVATGGQVLTWNVTTEKWEPKTPSGGLSGEGEPTLEAPIGSLYLRQDVGQAWVAAAAAVNLSKITYISTGARQTYTVGPGITSLAIKLWGAAGGGGVYSSNQGNSGAGGYTLANIPVAEGDVIDIDVGQGGSGAQPGTSGGLGGWPDGGYGGRGDVTCGGGGGSTRIWKNTVLMAVAGGGGGGTGYSNAAGAGGGLSGESSANPGGGSGGSQTVGGIDVSEPANAAKKGGYLQGGLGTNQGDRFTSGSDDGGGGGGGYYGGGGGGGDGVTGGGGSGYLNTAAGVTGVLQGGAGTQPPQTGDADYAFGIAAGVQGSSNGIGVAPSGGNGRVVVQPESDIAAWQRLAFLSDLGGIANISLENARLSSGEGAPTAGQPKGSLYIDETTGQVYQSGGVTGDITVVQSKLKGSDVVGGAPTTVTLTSAPAAGNWLICLFAYKSGVSAAPGWTLYPGAPSSGTEVNPGFAYKKVGVGESAAQTPYLATQRQGAAVMYELSGGGDDFSKILGAVSWQDDTTWTTATDDKGTPMSTDLDSVGFMLAVQKPWYTGVLLDAPWSTGGGHSQAIGDDRAFIAGTLTAAANEVITPDAAKTGELQSAYTAVLIKTPSQALWAPYKPATALDDLTDVTLGTASEGEVLTYSSGQWRAEPAAGSDLLTITNLTANRTLVMEDRASVLVLNTASDTVVSVPLFSSVAFPEGASITILRRGTGEVAIQPVTGVTIIYPADLEPTLRLQGSTATLLNIGLNTWSLFGDLGAP